jgi:hypothetical protein
MFNMYIRITKPATNPSGIYQCGHAVMEEFRGRELGVKAAEGFVRITGRGNGELIINN